MRETSFQSVYYSILRRLGLDPLRDDNYDRAGAVVSHINRRLKYVWRAGNWPELRVLEPRGFRPTWKSWMTFSVGDELFYDADGLYYGCILDAPAGTTPPNVTYYEQIEIVDFYLEYDQRGQLPMDEVLLVFATDPTQQRTTATFPFRPSSRGIDVQTSMNQVWVLYRMRPSQFTMTPEVAGKTYAIGDSYYKPEEGNCYRVALDVDDGTTVEEKIPFPDIFESYIVPMAVGDSMLEMSPQGNTDYQVRMAAAQVAYLEAQDYITSELDRLSRQGASHEYPPWHLRRGRGHGHRVEEATVPGSIIYGYTLGGGQLLFR